MGLLDKVINTINMINEVKTAVTYTPDIVCNNGTKMKKDCIYSRYNLDDMRRTKSNIYLLGNSNIPLAADEIICANTFLAEAAHLLSRFPKKQISKNKLCFKERLINGTNAYCFVTFNPTTKTGKFPKYPMVLHFYFSNDLFGDLFYAQNGEIEKGDIIVWGSGICYEVQLRMIGEDLKLNTIYRTNPVSYKKEKIYYQ